MKFLPLNKIVISICLGYLVQPNDYVQVQFTWKGWDVGVHSCFTFFELFMTHYKGGRESTTWSSTSFNLLTVNYTNYGLCLFLFNPLNITFMFFSRKAYERLNESPCIIILSNLCIYSFGLQFFHTDTQSESVGLDAQYYFCLHRFELYVCWIHVYSEESKAFIEFLVAWMRDSPKIMPLGWLEYI